MRLVLRSFAQKPSSRLLLRSFAQKPFFESQLIKVTLFCKPLSSLLCLQDSKEVRAASIALFGDLSRFGTGASEMSFLEQIHTNFISILLHLDEEQEVTKVRL